MMKLNGKSEIFKKVHFDKFRVIFKFISLARGNPLTLKNAFISPGS